MRTDVVTMGMALELKRVFPAPLAHVYRAWTEPTMMNEWFFSQPEMRATCTVDLRVGGRYEVRMQPPEGDPFVVSGVYREVEPREKLVFTWKWEGDETPGEMVVTVLFRAVGEEQTEVTLRHEGFRSDEERDNHAKGWMGTYEQLAAAL